MKKYIKPVVSILLVVALIASLSVSAFAASSEWVSRFRGFATVSQNSNSGYVQELQRFLQVYSTTTHDYIMNSGGLDGYFGTGTYNAVIYFQTNRSLSVDGIAGPNTWGKIAELASYSDYTSTIKLFEYRTGVAPESTLSYYIAKAEKSGSEWYFYSTYSNGSFLTSSFHHCA